MAVTLVTSGTKTATVTSEHTLYTTTTAGVYVFQVDISNMIAGDSLYLYIATKCLSGGTLRKTYSVNVTGAPAADNLMLVSVPIAIDVQYDAILLQSTGTGRSFPWKILSL